MTERTSIKYTERSMLIAEQLHQHLPPDFKKAVSIIPPTDTLQVLG